MAIAARITSTANCYVAGIFDDYTLSSNTTFINTSLSFGNTISTPINLIQTVDPLTSANTASSLWTIEMWVYYDGISSTTISNPINASVGASAGYYLAVQPSGNFSFVYSPSGSYQVAYAPFGGANPSLSQGWNLLTVSKGASATGIFFSVNGTNMSLGAAVPANISWPVNITAPVCYISPLRCINAYLGAVRFTTGANLYNTFPFTPNYLATANTSIVGTTTFLLAPKNIDKQIITNKGTLGTISGTGYTQSGYTPLNNNITAPVTLSNILSNGNMQCVLFDEVNFNMLTSGVAGTKAKMFSNGVFAIANTGILDEVNHPV